MGKKGCLLLILIFIILFSLSGFASAEQVDLYLFYGQGCPHCSGMKAFLSEIADDYDLNVHEYEVYANLEGRNLFVEMSQAFESEIQGVPTIFIDGKVIVGYSSAITDSLENEIKRCETEGCADPMSRLENGEDSVTEIVGESSPTEDPEKTELKKKLTLPAVLSAAAVDAINPCAFAVLIILLTTVLANRDRRKALYSGLAFTLSIYIMYFLMGIGLFSAIQAAGVSRWFFGIVAVLAIFIGLFNLKDYLWYGKWFIMEVPRSWRPKLKAVIRGVTSVPGAFLIGFVVSLFLLPCTSGPYIVILGLLAEVATRNYAMMLLLVYNAVFVLPMLVITVLIYFGLTTTEKAEKWRTSKLKVLHLIAGIIILLIGIFMLLGLYFRWI
ncbi:hypothetical protein KY330_04870 [Candidatus Woesearchaeota archaeon]|nr:hypothetical protein [Candidatus Woesearchaeota archaeon]